MWQHSDSFVCCERAASCGTSRQESPAYAATRPHSSRSRAAHRRASAWDETTDEWRVPPAIDFATLARADYFASLPQWLTLASHLSGRGGRACCAWPSIPSRRVRFARRRRRRTSRSIRPCATTFTRRSPAQTVDTPATRDRAGRTAGATRARATPLSSVDGRSRCARSSASDDESDARAFLDALDRTRHAAWRAALGLDATVAPATDPFFAPTARAKQLVQRLKELKHELLLPIGDGPARTTAAASFNLHDTFFGEAFDIRLPDGRPATTACVAFGLERWTLAFLATHGPDAAYWPAIPARRDSRRCVMSEHDS